MGTVAVIHRWFGVGGGESVCFHILESLQDEHEIHLYGLNDPNFRELNDAFGTDVDKSQVAVHVPSSLGLNFGSLYDRIEEATGGRVGPQGALQLAILTTLFEQEWNRYDLRITTHGELPLPSPTIQYIHHPFLNRWRGEGHFLIEGTLGRLVNRAFTKYIGADPDFIAETTLLTNSKWSSRQFKEIYGCEPEVVYPPIRTDDFSPMPWEERENGFVTVGRIAPDKRTLRACRIIEEVRSIGHDVHLHIVGPEGDNESYTESVQDFARENRWVTLEGTVERKRLVHLIQSHRWALHTKPHEHFGMVVAEYVAGGAVPFVPSSGGQIEIISHPELQTYDSKSNAVRKISKVLSNSDANGKPHHLVHKMPSQFSDQQFKQRVIHHTISGLDDGS